MCTSSHNVLNKFALVCIHTAFGYKLVLATKVAHPWLEVRDEDERKKKMERKKRKLEQGGEENGKESKGQKEGSGWERKWGERGRCGRMREKPSQVMSKVCCFSSLQLQWHSPLPLQDPLRHNAGCSQFPDLPSWTLWAHLILPSPDPPRSQRLNKAPIRFLLLWSHHSFLAI